MSSTILEELQQSPFDRRSVVLSDFIREQLVDFLGLDSVGDIATDQSFIDLGADSMQAVDFKLELESLLDCSLRTTLLFDYPKLDLLVDYLVNNVLRPEVIAQEGSTPSKGGSEEKVSSEEIAIIAMGGIFPGADDTETFWDKIRSGESKSFTDRSGKKNLDFGRVSEVGLNHLETIRISREDYTSMGRQQQLMYKVIADAMADYDVSLSDLSGRKTGVFIAAQSAVSDLEPPAESPCDANVAYRIPLPNEISFQLDLKGPSEVVNTFCTSVYVALHRAIQSISCGECEQAIVGGINTISAKQFVLAAERGLYDNLLSQENRTRSFCDDASGYARCEGVGAIIIKPVYSAEKDRNRVLAVIKGTAVFHGGRGYSVEAPNSPGMKEAIKTSVAKSGITTDSIDYVEAHGIGNVLADALELGAIDSAYRDLSSVSGKKWHVSSVKPTVGHPEIAAGMASLIKVVKAFEKELIPGLASLGVVNSEIGSDHSLILQKTNQPWPSGAYPRRAALNSFAIGGVNAHIILEEYSTEKRQHSTGHTDGIDIKKREEGNDETGCILSKENEVVLSGLFRDVFEMDLADIDRSLSLVEYGFDSIKVIQFVTRVNEKADLDIKVGQVLGVDNIAAFLELIDRKMSRKSYLVATRQEVSPSTDKVIEATTTKRCPVSEVQRGLWYISQTSPEFTSFNVPLTFKVKEEIKHDHLEQALALMLIEHPMLSVSFIQNEESEEIVQTIRAVESCQITSHLVLDRGQEVNQTLFEALRTPFDLEKDLLIRLYVVESEDNSDGYVFFVIHHIVFDGFSGALFIRSFWEKYHSLTAGEDVIRKAPDLAFFDFVAWEQVYLTSQRALDDQAWWKTELADQSPTINLPYDKLPQTDPVNLGIGCEKLVLEYSPLAALKNLALSTKVNLSVLLLAIFQVLIHKLTQEEDIAVTTPVRGRPRQAHEDSIGCYINVMVTRSRISGDQAFDSLVQETRQRFISGLDHANYPLPKLIADLGLTMANPKEAAFPISYTYQNIFDEIIENEGVLGGIQPLFSIYQQVEDNYTLEIYDFRDRLEINLKYKRSLFERNTIQRHLTYFNKLMEGIIENPSKRVKDYAILSADEKRQLLDLFNNTQSTYPKDHCVHDLFEAQVKKAPDQIAIICRDEALNYRELEDRTRRLALYLQQHGVGPETLVGVCIERSIEAIVAILGIIRAGGAYVPIDTNFPEDRISYVLEDSRINLLLSREGFAEKLQPLVGQANCQMILLDADWAAISKVSGSLDSKATTSDLAYVIYTSGSTGKPKGVMIEHSALMNYALNFIHYFKVDSTDKFIHGASISFDISVEEIFPILLSGGSLVISKDGYLVVDEFVKEVEDYQVTIVSTVPAVIEQINMKSAEKLLNVRVLISGADVLKPQWIDQLHQKVNLYNTYGPTETTVCASYFKIEAGNSGEARIPLGYPISNTKLYVLAEDLTLLPIGVAGELHIAGHGLARGYLNNPRLTEQKFIENPFGPGRLYKTGDLVRWLPNGTIDFIDRIDNQVKVRGFRVELGEIENVLIRYEGVVDAVVIVQEDLQGNKLIAYFTGNKELEVAKLRSYLRKELPDFMIPAALVRLDEIPVTSVGKANRRLLQSRNVNIVSGATYVAPITNLESSLVEIWQQVLGIEKIGVRDDFFELGGHSLLAVQIILRINKLLAANVSLRLLFDAADVKNLAKIIAESEQIASEDTLTYFEKESQELII